MPRNFSCSILFDKRTFPAVFIPQMRQDGLHYEVNIKGFPRFHMAWTALGRYDVLPDSASGIPYDLVLSASDAIEKHHKS